MSLLTTLQGNVRIDELFTCQPSHLSYHLFNVLLSSNGLLSLTGALAAEQGTPGMIGYGIAKAAVHQLVKSLASNGSGLPSGAVVTAILP